MCLCFQMHKCGRCSGLTVSVLGARSSIRVLSASWGYCVVFLGKTKDNFFHSLWYMYSEQPRVTRTEVTKPIAKNNHEHPYLNAYNVAGHLTYVLYKSEKIQHPKQLINFYTIKVNGLSKKINDSKIT